MSATNIEAKTNPTQPAPPIAIVLGVGARQGIGAATAIAAARAGMHVFLAGRTAEKLTHIANVIEGSGGQATAVVTDSTNAMDIKRLFKQACGTGGRLQLVVYNVGRNLPASFMESSTKIIEDHWRRCVLGGTLAGQAAIRQMLEQNNGPTGRGTIIYTGASASLRGKPLFAAFASAKAGLRNMSQAMAREFGPKGIHVAHVVVDGLVDGAVVRSIGPFGKLLLKRKGPDGALKPDAIAAAFLALHAQTSSAWTHELDLRPYKEAF